MGISVDFQTAGLIHKSNLFKEKIFTENNISILSIDKIATALI